MDARTKTVFRTAFSLLLLAIAVSPVAAASGESGGLFSGDLGNAIWTLVIFGGLIFVLYKFAWGPILDNLQQREDFIRNSLEEAKRDREDAKARLAEYEERLTEARAEARAIVEEGRRDAEAVKLRLDQEAREEADKMVERAKREIGIARETAVKDLYDLSGQLATHIASQIVARELRAEDHEKLISDAIAEMASPETH